MGEEERKRFLSLHKSEFRRIKDEGGVYNLRQEMIKYCYDDCLVLAVTFSCFNESMINELKKSGIEGIVYHDFTIIADFMTLLQLVSHWFVGCMMLDCMIAVVPNGGYDSEREDH